MQGKGIVKFFLVVMILLSAIQYWYTTRTDKVENAAIEFATEKAASIGDEALRTEKIKEYRTRYIDSMSSEVVASIPLIKDFTYQDLKSKELALGLDLKGGMSVVLQVDLKDFIIALANDSKDPTFVKSLNDATQAQKSSQTDFVTLFSNAWAANANGQKMTSIFHRNESLRDQLNLNSTDAEVTALIRKKADETVDLTFKMLKQRIDKMGVVQPNITLDKARDLILVELPGIDNPVRARNFLSAAAKLEFWNVYRTSDPGLMQSITAANEKLKSLGLGNDVDVEPVVNKVYSYTDSLGNVDSSRYVLDTVQSTSNGPLFSMLQLNQGQFYPSVIGAAEKNKRKAIDDLFKNPALKNILPRDLILRWGNKPSKDAEGNYTNLYYLYALKKERGSDDPPLSGEHVTKAAASPNAQTGEVQVSLTMNGQGTQKWAKLTERNAQDGNRAVAIVLDDEVVSAPSVRVPILNGSSSITGDFSISEGRDLANILQVGKLPARTRIIQESLVGPSLGADNINRSLNAMIIGLALVLLFMVFYYGSGGFVSILALILNVIFIGGALASFGTVLTLPGIAGIILTIGMAVDANVIIYERIREEIMAGKTLKTAISDGFNHSYSAIIDANVTTILVAFVLIYFGMGPIKGFAVVLAIGVVSSVFTAVLVGRMMIDWWTGKGKDISFWTGPTKNAFNNIKVDWLSKRKVAYMVSGALILMSFISFFTRGFELGVDFKGGYSYNITFDDGQNVDAQTLRKALTTSFGSTPVVKAVDTKNTFNVTTSYNIDDNSEKAADVVMEKLYEGVSSVVPGVKLESFRKPDGVGTHVVQSSKVGATIADDITKSSIEAAFFALLIIFLYIFIRFSRWQYSAGAVAALFHDTIITLGLFSLLHGIVPFSLEIDQAFIAAILTVIGYSINDTVVVFDRIREMFGLHPGKKKEEVINKAINTTLSRTIITSLTTLFVVLVLFIFGGGTIKGFAFALLIGIIVGTYSSIFIATPVMSDIIGEIKPRVSRKSSSSDKKNKKHFTRTNA